MKCYVLAIMAVATAILAWASEGALSDSHQKMSTTVQLTRYGGQPAVCYETDCEGQGTWSCDLDDIPCTINANCPAANAVRCRDGRQDEACDWGSIGLNCGFNPNYNCAGLSGFFGTCGVNATGFCDKNNAGGGLCNRQQLDCFY